MSILLETGLVKKNNISATEFEKLTPNETFLDFKYTNPSEYISKYWDLYNRTTRNNKSQNGNIFELIIKTLLYREKITPFYAQAKVNFVPNINFDIILYCKTDSGISYPINLSLKTSLRERYKQADLESMALKNVHRKAKCYLFTLNTKEAENLNKKIIAGDVFGIDRVFTCTSKEFDVFFKTELKNLTLIESESIPCIDGNLIYNH